MLGHCGHPGEVTVPWSQRVLCFASVSSRQGLGVQVGQVGQVGPGVRALLQPGLLSADTCPWMAGNRPQRVTVFRNQTQVLMGQILEIFFHHLLMASHEDLVHGLSSKS